MACVRAASAFGGETYALASAFECAGKRRRKRLCTTLAVNGRRNRFADGQPRQRRHAFRLLVQGNQKTTPVKHGQRVRNAIDERPLARLQLRQRDGPRRNRLKHGVDGRCQKGEFVLPLPFQTRTVAIAVAFAEVADLLRHGGKRIEQQPPLKPEDRQDEHNADHGDEECQSAQSRPCHVGERLRQGDGDHCDRVARDVADGEDRLKRIAAEVPESTRIEVERLRKHRLEAKALRRR